MKKIDVKGKDAAALNQEVQELRMKLRDLAFKSAGAATANVKERRQYRKDIARLLTALKATVVDNA